MKYLTTCKIFSFIIVIFITLPVFAKHKHLEKEYQTAWCNAHNGIMEYKLDDNTRVDCLTNEYAVEFDFASKWAESIGQSLYYAQRTKRKTGGSFNYGKACKRFKILTQAIPSCQYYGH